LFQPSRFIEKLSEVLLCKFNQRAQLGFITLFCLDSPEMTSASSDVVTIRACTKDDIAAVCAIYRFHVEKGTASFETEAPDEAEMLRRFNLLQEGHYPYIVAELNGEVSGYAYAGAFRPRPAYGATVEDSIYVDESKRGHGIGIKLLDKLIEECTKRGFRQMIAVIGDSANLGSINVHRKAGFEMSGTLKSTGWKHGRWLDTVLMQRSLGEGDETPRC
jgi:L-amino acid N-acyltransferase YncA